MKFLRPELYVQLNSPDAAAADRAEEAIDRADEQARDHWQQIKQQLPENVVRFGEEMILHDAQVFGPAWASGTDATGAGEVVIVAYMYGTLDPQYDDALVFLRYIATEEASVDIPVRSDVFKRLDTHWIWDEFDVVGEKLFSHSIFLSDGRVIAIRFRAFEYRIAPPVNPGVFEKVPTKPPAKVTA